MTDQETQAKRGGINPAMLAAAAAGIAAAGYYFYASEDAQKHRRIAAKWANDFKGDVIANAKKIGTIDKKTVATAVDRAVKAYAGMRNLDPSALASAAKELKRHWQMVAQEIRAPKKSARTAAKKSVTAKKAKRAPQRVAKKSA